MLGPLEPLPTTTACRRNTTNLMQDSPRGMVVKIAGGVEEVPGKSRGIQGKGEISYSQENQGSTRASSS
jgi:hypothetical protein